MQDVVLVEAEVDADALGPTGQSDDESAEPPGVARARSAAAWFPRTRRWWAAGSVLALLVGANAVASGRREQARVAALAELPGIIAPVDGPLTELWQTDASPLDAPAVAGRLLAVLNGRDGSASVVGLDPRTGRVGWRTQVRPASSINGWAACAVPDPPGRMGGTASTPTVTCVVADDVVVTDEDISGYVEFPSRSRLLVLDARDGRVLSEDPALPSLSVAALGADLVTSSVAADGRVHVARADARGGPVRWRFVGPDPIPPDDAHQRMASIEVIGNRVVVHAGTTWVLSADGDVLGHWTPDPASPLGSWVAVMPGGRLVADPVVADDLGATWNQVTDLETGRSFAALGNPVQATLDDGSLADLFLTTAIEHRELVAYDVGSGHRRWTATAKTDGAVLVVDQRIVRTETHELQSVDGRTGKPVWTTPIASTAPSSLVSDGRLVLLIEPAAGPGAELVAYGLDDGRLRWKSRLPEDLYLFAIDGRLFGWSENGTVVALG